MNVNSTQDLEQANISENDQKVDVSPQNNEEAELQKKAAEEMGVDSNIESVPVDGEQDKNENQTDEGVKDENVNEDNQQPDYGYVDTESKDSPKTIEEALEKINKITSDFERFKEETNIKLTESQSEAIRLKNENDQLKTGDKKIIENQEQEEAKKIQSEFIDFVSGHQDVLGVEIIEDYKKFVASGNNAFIFNNPALKVLAEEIENTSTGLPFKDRLERAFKIGFTDKIAEVKSKQAQVKAEIKNQEVNKMAKQEHQGQTQKSTAYTSEQMALAEQMGVELK
jgi:hypothetical protein